MPSRITKRQPLSCENCRQRKIRCSGNRNPCDTCVRRGFASSCHYLRDATPGPQSPPYDELLDRMSRLEGLLKQQSGAASTPMYFSGQVEAPTSTNLSGSQESSAAAGTIVVSDSGYVRFVPGAYMPHGGDLNQLLESAATPESATCFPFSADATSSRHSLIESLPPIRQCEELKVVFFEVFSPLFHILHEPRFDTAYKEFRLDPHGTPLAFLALLFVVLAVAVTALDEDNALLHDLGRESSAAANMKAIAGRYRFAAMRCLAADQFLWQHNLHTLQALVLLIYALNHSHGPAWVLLGTTFNVAVAIGCHIDPADLGLDPVESEERRRCWAALMMLHTIQNTCMGNLASVRITATTRMPVDRDDEDISETGIRESTDHSLLGHPLTKMTYILYKFRLYDLAAKICVAPLSVQRLKRTAILALDRQIESEEEEHVSRFHDLSQLPIYHLAHHYILKNYTNHLYLILHRPYLSQAPADSPTLANENEGLAQSRTRCQSAAMTILDSHKQLYQSSVLKPYCWYIYGLGSFHAFLAASTLMVLNARQITASPAGSGLPRSNETTLTALRDCLTRFEEMAPRSELCAKATPVLRRLLQRYDGRKNDDMTQLKADHIRQIRQVDWQSSSGSSGMTNLDEFNANLGNGYSLPSPPLQDYASGCYSGMPIQNHLCMSNDANYSNAEVDDWLAANSQLESLMSHLPPQQWLAPSSFPWDQWQTAMTNVGGF